MEAPARDIFRATGPTDSIPAHIQRIVLTGFMGAGKTTVGRILAQRIGWTFFDLDSLVESRAGLSVPAIFSTHGEPYFRRLESQALASALARKQIVLALGGGAPETPANSLLLEQNSATVTILLDAPFATLYQRCVQQALCTPSSAASAAGPVRTAGAAAACASAADARPNLADPQAAEARYAVRRPIYSKLAHHIVDTTTLTTDHTVSAILAALESGSC